MHRSDILPLCFIQHLPEASIDTSEALSDYFCANFALTTFGHMEASYFVFDR